jgi:hypothetical protein
MTAEPMITKGTFSDFRIIRTRKLAQIVIEIPIEEADAALAALGGLPRSDHERWVAVARLEMPVDVTMNIKYEKARRAFHTLPAVQQAAIKSKDAEFQFWMNKGFVSEPDCAAAIRKYCGVNSRADIEPGSEAEKRWHELLRDYEGVR